MEVPFDPAMLTTEIPGATDEVPMDLGAAVTATRQAFSGMEELPIDALPLEDGATDERPLPTETAATTPATPLPIDPAAVATDPTPLPTPSPELAAMQYRLALLEAELATRRAQDPAPLPATPPTIGDDVVDRVAHRWQQTFSNISEQRADESESQFETRRASEFARTIIAAVYEDLLPTEAVQARFRPTVEQVATQAATQAMQATRSQDAAADADRQIVAQAIAAATAAGLEVFDTSDPRHQQSAMSRMFWGTANQVDGSQPVAKQIADTIALIRQVVPAAPAAPTTEPTPRPQPMARQGAVPTPTTATDQPDDRLLSINDIMRQQQRTRTIGMGPVN